MKIVILAAGMGTRLLGFDQPKSLLTLANGKSLLEMQLEALSLYTSLDNLRVVIGYKKELFYQTFPNLNYIENPNFSSENTAKSLLKGIETIDDDLLWINGDLLFKPAILKECISRGVNTMAVAEGVFGEEEMKYLADSFGKILQISKQLEHSEGEAFGINFFTKTDLAKLKVNLKKCDKEDFFEKGVQYCIEDQIDIYKTVFDPDDYIEIDFLDDLMKANKIIKRVF